MAGTFLLENQTEDTDGTQDTITLENTTNVGKWYTICAYGTWDSATITTKISPDGGTTWIEAGEYTTFTANSAGKLLVNPGFIVRADLTDAEANTDLNCKIF